MIGGLLLLILLSLAVWLFWPTSVADQIAETERAAYKTGFGLQEAQHCGVPEEELVNIKKVLELNKESQPLLRATIEDAVARGRADALAKKQLYGAEKCDVVVKSTKFWETGSVEVAKIQRHFMDRRTASLAQ